MISKKPVSSVHFSFILVCLMLLSGCSRTVISPSAFKTSIISAEPAATLCIEEMPKTLGHQYGLVILPLGVIDGGESARLRLSDEITVAAARSGVSLKYSCQNPDFTLRLTELNVSAWDWLFLRRVSVSIAGIISSSQTRPLKADLIKISAATASWRRFGFTSQLDSEFHRASQLAFRSVF